MEVLPSILSPTMGALPAVISSKIKSPPTLLATTKDFPPAILSAILSYQPKVELKKARLVCKTFDAAAVPFLFDEIFVTARYADMEKATLLASHFRPFVKTLIFCSEWFDPNVGFDVFERTIGDERLAIRHYNSYWMLREEWGEVLNEGEFHGHLSSILTVLANLQKIILTNVCRTQGLCWCHQAYVDVYSRTYNAGSDTNLPAFDSVRLAPEHICVRSTNGLEHKWWNAWFVISRALFTSGNTKVKAIVTEEGDRDSGVVVSAFCMTKRERFCAAKVLQNLTSLNLRLDAAFFDDAYDADEDVGSLSKKIYQKRAIARTLSAAINLESLVIDMIKNNIQWESEGEVITFAMVLGGCEMPRLEKFELSGLSLTEAGMTAFLQVSKGIRHLKFNHLRMVEGSWENMRRFINDHLPLVHPLKFQRALRGRVSSTDGGIGPLNR